MLVELNSDLVSFILGESVRMVIMTCSVALFAGGSGWVLITRASGADEEDWQSVISHLPKGSTFEPDADRIGRFELTFIPYPEHEQEPYPSAEQVALSKVG